MLYENGGRNSENVWGDLSVLVQIPFINVIFFFRIADPGSSTGTQDEDTLIDFTKPPPAKPKNCPC